MASTPMHVALYDAFGWQPPEFGHVPILVDGNGQKLSKRNADIDIAFYRESQGVLPEALVNFAALLGWSHSQRSDVFTLGELEKIVRISRVESYLLRLEINFSWVSSLSRLRKETRLLLRRSCHIFRKLTLRELLQREGDDSMT
jgi:glutamyl/glutaminyl-tRNA synthetase